MVSGLLFVLAKPIVTHPNDPASLAIAEFLKQNKAHLDFYQPAQQPSNKTKYTAVIGLSIIDDFARMKIQANKTLHTLPPVPADKVDNEVLEYLTRPPELDDEEYNPIELSEYLQPTATDDGIPDSPRGWEFRCPEPPWYETSAAFDAGDGKNCEDFDPHQDPELEYFSDDAVAAWAKAAIDECIEGARPRFYEALAITKEESGCVYSGDYDPQPVTSQTPLSPSLFITLIPHQPHPRPHRPFNTPPELPTIPPSTTQNDLIATFNRYVFLTSHPNYRRTNIFKLDDNPEIPRCWLVVQEFTSEGYYVARWKKKQAEFWWRKNGWEGVVVEVFRRRFASGGGEEV